ncbi:hypothetical protein VVT58_15540 [Sphingobium sp. SJ10-10]|uniref:hypothetical protein n=1 Tax=Sphingobium sp. SJ10-10 TaxID=3114999 RepID=UPI002E17FFA3|nr:hypothetical protein [Sphingobium sp. SJ10-10]
MTWHPNTGRPPIFCPEHPDQPCPPHLFAKSEAAGARARVKLRNGVQPDESWPVIGRPLPTRWTLTGCSFDILEWKRA